MHACAARAADSAIGFAQVLRHPLAVFDPGVLVVIEEDLSVARATEPLVPLDGALTPRSREGRCLVSDRIRRRREAASSSGKRPLTCENFGRADRI